MSRPPRRSLSPLESRVMDFAWRNGRVTAAEVVKELAGRLTNASVRTVLRRIEAKGFLTHHQDSRTFVYTPAIDPRTVARSAVRRLLDRFYGGSAEQLIVGLVDGRLIGQQTLRDLSRKVSALESAERRKKRRL